MNIKNYFLTPVRQIDDIAIWSKITKESLINYRNQIKNGLVNIPPEFFGLTNNEIDEFFKKSIEEVELLTCINYLSAIEAKFKTDYNARSKKQKKDQLSKDLKALYSRRTYKANFDDDILDIWKKNHPSTHIFSQLKDALKMRNWLAHGRYWKLQTKKYTDIDIYTICNTIITNVNFIN